MVSTRSRVRPVLRRRAHPAATAKHPTAEVRRAGGARARQLLMYAKMVKASEAAELGLADELVPEGKAEEIAIQRALTLAQMPPFAFAIAKQQLGLWPVKLEEALEMEALAQAGCFGADEFQEGFSAFMEKRPPNFRKG